MKVQSYSTHLPAKIASKLTDKLFVLNESLQSRFAFRPKLKILFSDVEVWQKAIRPGFKLTQHEITFGELSPDKIKAHHLVVPLTIPDLKYLNEVRHLIVNNPIPIPSIETLSLCDDKVAFNQTLIEKGFADFIPTVGGEFSYPYILKKRIDQWGKHSHLILNAEQAQDFSDRLNHPEYFAQAFVQGRHEYATHIVFKDQKIVCSLNIEYGFTTEMPIKGKDHLIYRKICSCPYLDVFSAVLSSIGFEGLCCVNYKVWHDRPYILEINPRFGSSLCPFFFAFVRHLN